MNLKKSVFTSMAAIALLAPVIPTINQISITKVANANVDQTNKVNVDYTYDINSIKSIPEDKKEQIIKEAESLLEKSEDVFGMQRIREALNGNMDKFNDKFNQLSDEVITDEHVALYNLFVKYGLIKHIDIQPGSRIVRGSFSYYYNDDYKKISDKTKESIITEVSKVLDLTSDYTIDDMLFDDIKTELEGTKSENDESVVFDNEYFWLQRDSEELIKGNKVLNIFEKYGLIHYLDVEQGRLYLDDGNDHDTTPTNPGFVPVFGPSILNNKPETNPGEGEDSKPETNPGEGEDSKPETNPGEGEDSKPETNPGEGEDDKPETNPGEGEDSKPETNPGEGEDNKPETNPSEGEDNKPETKPNENNSVDEPLINAWTMSGVGTVHYKAGYSINVWDGIVNPKPTGKKLTDGTRWQIFGAATDKEGNLWFRVGANEFVQAQYISFNSIGRHKPVKPNSVKINYKKGYGINVWDSFENRKWTGKKLNHGTSWKVISVARDMAGHDWYEVGHNQWIQAQYTK